MNGENQPLIIDELVEIEKKAVQIQEFEENYHSIQRKWPNIPQFNEKEGEMSTCHQLVVETLGPWLIMPRNLPDTALISFQSI